MISRLKNFLKSLERISFDAKLRSEEAVWAHVYHDSIRGRDYLEKSPLNIGRWAGGYPFFYILNRVMHDVKPQRILDIGLGESSKFISICLKNFIGSYHHDIIEGNKEWINNWNNNHVLYECSNIHFKQLKEKDINGVLVNSYSGIENLGFYDFIIVDGVSSAQFSRAYALEIVENYTKHDQFILILDDTNREGEQQTEELLNQHFKRRGIEIFTAKYAGLKASTIFATKQYKFLTSI